MKLPEVWISQKGERKLSTNREALEKLEVYLYARPVVSLILGIRDLAKQLEVFETEIDPDGRFRASYNIAGTETGRPSSSSNAFGTGGNAQNIAAALRYVFVADKGWKLGVIDLEQVEARDVGYLTGVLFDDWTYLDACESGDLHTRNARLVWPELPWTGDPKKDRALAEQNFYRDFSYRDMSKRGGHLSNYYGTAWTMGRSLKIPIKLAEDFQHRYCKGPAAAYPCIPRYWQWVAQALQTTNSITTPFGRQRHFFGRPGDDTTLREAIAFVPQSMTAERMNLGLWRVWKAMPQVQLLAQTYDSITFQYREEEDENEVISEILERIKVPLTSPGGRVYTVPGEAKVGWNWANRHNDGKPLGKGNRFNPLGLVKWKPGFRDSRTRN
jgi:DNA polymerase I-like protein with 3'-5' exonuclease and polymerase domains